MNLEAFHEYLLHDLPSNNKDIAARLKRCHEYLPTAYAGFPKPEDVPAAMAELERQGLVERMGDEWRWLCGKVKEATPQRVLFA